MKTTNLILIAGLLYLLCTPAKLQAQMDENPWGGLQSTWENSENDDIPKFLGNIFLEGNDIEMIMIADNGDKTKGAYIEDVRTNTWSRLEYKNFNAMEIRFDFENRAQIMIGGEMRNPKGNNAELTFKKGDIQYTDADGYWYTPVEISTGTAWIRFNAKMAVQNDLEHLKNKVIEYQKDTISKRLIGLTKDIDWKYLTTTANNKEILYNVGLFENIKDNDSWYNKDLEKIGEEELNKIKKKVDEKLDILLHKLFDEIQGFPIFIHWAFLYTPETVRDLYPDAEPGQEKFFDIPNCTVFTRTKGPEKGKKLYFDQYDRLIGINDKKDGMARYFYDRDITVTLPKKYNNMADILSGKVRLPRN
ncbi:MAG: hypothetical protein ACK5M7_02580 [Draconibacterium sp.]